jgi:hypothetical protein
MLKILITLMVFSTCLVSANETDYIVRAFGGYNSIAMSIYTEAKMKTRAGVVIGVGIGKKIEDYILLEGEISYRYNETGDITIHGKESQFVLPVHGDVTSLTVIGNVIFEFPTDKIVKPYVGTGIGCTAQYANWSVNVIQDSAWYDYEGGGSFAYTYQLIAGIRTSISYTYYCAAEVRLLDSVLDHMCENNRSIIFSFNRIF